MNVRRYLSSSLSNAGSSRSSRQTLSSSSSAGMRVSGTYRPPYGPNLPVRVPCIRVPDGVDERANLAWILAPHLSLDAAGNVDAVWTEPRDQRADILRS